MKLFWILFLTSALTCCDFTSRREKEINDLENRVKSRGEELHSWNEFRDSVFFLAEADLAPAIFYIDKRMISESNPKRKFDLHYLKGEVYYKYDSISKSIIEFTKSMPSHEYPIYPKSRASRARSYIRQKKYSLALTDLKKAAESNHGYLWNIGNYYEIIHKKDSAIYYYNQLYLENNKAYKYCINRIIQLNQSGTDLMTDLDLESKSDFEIDLEIQN